MRAYLNLLIRVIATCPDPKITVRTLTILIYLTGQRFPVRSRDLARALDLPKPTVSRLIRALARIDFIEFGKGDKDQRDCWVSPTEKGRAFVASLSADAQALAA